VLYWNYWSSFLEQWTDLALQGESRPRKAAAPPPSPAASADADGLTSNEKYDYLTEYGTQILCLLDTTKGCTYLSRNFESITGQKCAARTGEKFYGVVHSDFRARLKEILATNAEGKNPYPFRCKLQHADKKWYWYLFLIHPKHEGKAGEFVCIVENVHDTMLAQNTLQKARLEAELALRARSEFLSNMSHELRTPLNAVIGFSQIIESEMFGKIENPQYMDYVRHIQESGYDLLAKIEDLLEIANIDAGRVALTREEVYAGDILRHVCEAQMHHATSAQVKLEAVPLATDMLLNVDRLKLQHILGHLVANAIKFSREGGRIAIEAWQSEKGQLILAVEDNGLGMSEAQCASILTALKEDSCWTAGDNRTIGLGLALTREFVELHGGQVEVSSKMGEGTRILLSLPKDCIRATSLKNPDYLRQVAAS
jgi:PAS domain S-box-containing protein